MIRDVHTLRRWEDDLLKKGPQPSFKEALKLFESMWKEGITLGVFPLSNTLDGIEVDIELARVLNCLKNSLPE
ncbi:MAG: hypothetical protein QME78_17205 [Thermodesulfobacteriota bacterium]|nr:hypothetical protein [Thermodesulfobacteriota bacterium]